MKDLKTLKVIGVPWHTAHQYEIAKLFKQYDHLLNHYREWGTSSRPMPKNMDIVLELDKSKYDLAILHVDQQCINPANNKGKLFREFRDLTEGMPRLVINHMTPYDDTLELDECIEGMRELVGDIPMIVNSKQAAAQWGWGTPIIHGIDPNEWLNLAKEPRVVTSLSPGGMNKAYRRELLHVTIDMLRERGLDLVWVQTNIKCKTWEEYKEFIGRSLIYFQPTWQSPMPRSRTEAMMSGACIVSTRHHDWADYIKDGVNGYIIPDNPKSATDLIAHLLTDGIEEARRVGQAGREFAMKEFSLERWAKDWSDFLNKEVL